MPACSAPNCDVGKGGQKYPPGVSRYKFPIKKPELCKKWVKAVARKDFDPMKTPTVILCSKHFRETDFVTESQEKKLWNRNNRGQLKRKRLKEDAVPSVFDIPQYLVRDSPEKRKTSRTSVERRTQLMEQRQQEEIEAAAAAAEEQNVIQDLDDLKQKLKYCKSTS